ncbi:glycosyltransferase [Lactococcus termiticola]|uniref:Poly(Glycerol-phosphate) alpha-glucosyltransferase n=1 Tax=Lactococcus termiticola TaxID=2169526 RepID=A0A2R5HIW6_9LACT|nr:glycosyltransferase [Lactococcus termiticola]GBG96358.1 poly(glycerol-phosphate) alpha-glucosyltransferase [Lactococcus termiticola]
MNFFINRAMGIGNSGVEHAQFYRAELFDMEGLPYKYLFTELVKELPEAMAHWNIRPEQVINLYEFFTFGKKVATEGAPRKNKREDKTFIDGANTHRIVQTLTSTGMLVREHIEKSPNPKTPGTLLVSRYKIEIFNAETMERKLMLNEFAHPSRGRILENIHIYDFEGQDLFFRNEVTFQRFFFETLTKIFEGKNTFIMDRGEESEAAFFGNEHIDFNLIEIIHADHLGDRDEPTAPLWNNYYEYLLTHVDQADRIVVSTELQRQDFLLDFPGMEDKFVTIPVGGISETNMVPVDPETTPKRARRFMTASRLAGEKHIDQAVKAVSRLHDLYPDITFDIYGQGGEDQKIRETIEECKAQDYIKLMGHSNNLAEDYKKYDAFISASYSEGFGLTYIEALNAGLPVVTFKARFGAMELVKDGINGYLRDFKRDDEEYSIEELTKGIQMMMEQDYPSFKKATIASVKDFHNPIIAKKWSKLINEL